MRSVRLECRQASAVVVQFIYPKFVRKDRERNAATDVRDFDGGRRFAGFGPRNRERASFVGPSGASGALSAVETGALCGAQSLVAKVCIAHCRVADSDEQLLRDAECETLVMREKTSNRACEGSFGSRKDPPRAPTPGSNTEREVKCDSNPSDGLMPGTGLQLG